MRPKALKLERMRGSIRSRQLQQDECSATTPTPVVVKSDVGSVTIVIDVAEVTKRVSEGLHQLGRGESVTGLASAQFRAVATEAINANLEWAAGLVGGFVRTHMTARAQGTANAVVAAVLAHSLEAIASKVRAEAVRFDLPRNVLEYYWHADRLAAPRRGGNVPIDDEVVLSAFNSKVAVNKQRRVRAFRSEATSELAVEWAITEKGVESRIRVAEKRKRDRS